MDFLLKIFFQKLSVPAIWIFKKKIQGRNKLNKEDFLTKFSMTTGVVLFRFQGLSDLSTYIDKDIYFFKIFNNIGFNIIFQGLFSYLQEYVRICLEKVLDPLNLFFFQGLPDQLICIF